MNTDTKELVKKVFGKYALMIRKAHGHWAFSDGELEQFVNMIRSDERKACISICEEHWRHSGTAQECADAIRARGNE